MVLLVYQHTPHSFPALTLAYEKGRYTLARVEQLRQQYTRQRKLEIEKITGDDY
ncbi:hypothetical protein N9219_00435 [bacterium]|nr:hypothetical protein [bacterium]